MDLVLSHSMYMRGFSDAVHEPYMLHGLQFVLHS